MERGAFENRFNVVKIFNVDVKVDGAVQANVNVAPPVLEDNEIVPEAPASYVGARSAINAVDGDVEFSIVIKQFSCSLTRTTVFMLTDPAHESVEDVVSAPWTVIMAGLENIVVAEPPLGFTLAEMANDVVADAGAVTRNVNVAPPFVVKRTGEPLPLGPYVNEPKSLFNPVVAPALFLTEILHFISSPTFTLSVPDEEPTQDNDED